VVCERKSPESWFYVQAHEAMLHSVAHRPSRPAKDRPRLGFQPTSLPIANHLQNGVFVGLCNHRQLEYPNRDPVADPTAPAAGRPHLYVPSGAFKVSPAGHLVAAESATTAHFTCDACLPRSISRIGLQITCSSLAYKRSLPQIRAVVDRA
jgi:hypothetical protein